MFTLYYNTKALKIKKIYRRTKVLIKIVAKAGVYTREK